MVGQKNHYKILTIFTDGEIMDRKMTINSIVEASYLPISIIIIGIGNANFSTMNELDSDNGLLKSNLSGKKAARDIV